MATTQADRLALKRIFHELRALALQKQDHLPRLKLEQCYLADREHAKSDRQYAHFGHKKGTICYAGALEGLPEQNQRGVLLHEIGHAIDEYLDEDDPDNAQFVETEDDEIRADLIVVEMLGVELTYDDNDVQTVAE